MKAMLLFLIFTTLPKAFAFDWSLHRSITARALSPLGFSINAIDQMADANINIDRNEGSNPATHADSEAFEAASSLMRSRLRITAISVINGDMKKARTTFGYITHTVQDFYAHTNYVEYMPGAPIDLLYLTNPASSVTCSKNNMINGLTSGYYPDSSTPPRKCSHSTLNKDSGNYGKWSEGSNICRECYGPNVQNARARSNLNFSRSTKGRYSSGPLQR